MAIVEDDPEIQSLVAGLFLREEFEVATCWDGAELDRLLHRRQVDLIVLDLMLAGEDGLSVCRRLQARAPHIPVLIVSAKGDTIDRIVGLELGADDYLPKPFDPRELLARAWAILRRRAAVGATASAPPGETFRFAGWTLEAASRDLRDPDGKSVVLSGGEFDLLLAFVEHPQRVLSRDRLMDWTRGRDASSFDRTIDVQLSRLRKKLGDEGGSRQLIRTIRGGGYMFTAPVGRV